MASCSCTDNVVLEGADYRRFLRLVADLNDEIYAIQEYGHSMKVSGQLNDACNLLAAAYSNLEDVNALVVEAYEL